MTSYDLLRDLAVPLERLTLEREEVTVSAGWTRVTTTVVLAGARAEGRGEDVSYSPDDQDAYPALEVLREHLVGAHTIDSFSQALARTPLFTRPPVQEAATDYRRWAFESAALDLALRAAGRSLPEALGRSERPLRFAVSTAFDIRAWLAVDAGLEFKLDATPAWSEELMRAYAATGRVPVIDLKGRYRGALFGGTAFEPELYRRVVEIFPDAVLEDPSDDPQAQPILAGCGPRLSWDAPVHSLADLDALQADARHVNIKPSRFGSLSRLFECVEACLARGMSLYGGGQFELGVGRGQAQQLASLLYPDGPNDLAPSVFNEVGEATAGLPSSPLPPPPTGAGFGWTGRS